MERGTTIRVVNLKKKNDLPNYSVTGENPLGSYHQGGTFDFNSTHLNSEFKLAHTIPNRYLKLPNAWEGKMNLSWTKCQGNKWCSLLNVNLGHDHFKNLGGIYIIWHSGEHPWTVYVGQGIIAERLADHRQNGDILRFLPDGLFVTWAQVDENSRNGVEHFLAKSLKPKVGANYPTDPPIQVNFPW